ncbi:MAG: LysE family transporter [Paracoccaceae bacterium]
MSELLLTFLVVHTIITLSPGPALVVTIKTAVTQGRGAGIQLSLGLATAVTLWALASLLGLSLLFEAAPYLQTAFRFIGALYLVWLGVTMWRHAGAPLPATRQETKSNSFKLGFITDMANPKAVAYFTAVFATLLPANITLLEAALLLAMIFLIEFVWYSLVTLGFSRPKVQSIYLRLKTWIDRAFGTILVALGIKLAAN